MIFHADQSDLPANVTDLVRIEPNLVKLTRVRKFPTNFKDYIGLLSTMVTNCTSHLPVTLSYFLHHYFSYNNNLSPSYTKFLVTTAAVSIL